MRCRIIVMGFVALLAVRDEVVRTDRRPLVSRSGGADQ